MRLKYNTWRYHKSGKTRLFQAGEEINEDIWVDSPAEFGIQPGDCEIFDGDKEALEETEEVILADLSKVDIIGYAETMGLKLDKRLSKPKMIDALMENDK